VEDESDEPAVVKPDEAVRQRGAGRPGMDEIQTGLVDTTIYEKRLKDTAKPPAANREPPKEPATNKPDHRKP
jgi:hypothetical protein